MRLKNPALLAARANWGKWVIKTFDRVFIKLMFPLYLAQPIVAGMDAVRFRWSSTPLATVYVGLVLLAAGMLLIRDRTSRSGGGVNGVQEFTQSGTFTVPSGISHVMVELWGAGGGGGASGTADGTSRSGPAGSGGGGGGYTRAVIAVTSGAVYNVVIAAGGVGGASCGGNNCNGSPGGNGGASEFTDSSSNVLAQAGGGEGGGGAPTPFGFGCGSPGSGGIGDSTPGMISRTGGGGQHCVVSTPGAGGSPPLGSLQPLQATGGPGGGGTTSLLALQAARAATGMPLLPGNLTEDAKVRRRASVLSIDPEC